MKAISRLLALTALLATAQIATAAAPSAINYQGRFTDAAGVPQPGVKAMSLKIYDAATVGILLYSESVGNVAVDANGVYGFQFGATDAGAPASLSSALSASAEQWLELAADGVAQAPRQKILAVPFALMANGLPNGAVSSAMIADGAVGLSKLTGLGTAATAAREDFAAAAPPGSFSTDLAALRGGVPLHAIYRKSAGAIAWRQPVTEKIALLGDSITEQGSAGDYYMNSNGYGTWARIFGNTQWDAEPNGSSLEFATGGFRTYDIEAIHLPQVLASNATRCVVQGGINDYSVGQTSAQTAGRLRSMWSTLKAAGITPIATTILPDVLNVPRATWLVATNTLIREYAAADGVVLCNWTSLLELVAGTGLGDPQYFADYVHPNALGANRIGRHLAFTIGTIGLDSRNNYSNNEWISTNSGLTGSGGQPSSWNTPAMGAGATLTTKTLTSSAEGNWWQIDFTNGQATAPGYISNITTSLESPAGLTVEGICELQVISGELTQVMMRTIAQGGGQSSATPFDPSPSSRGKVTAGDGMVVLRTPKSVMSAGVTLAWPQLQFVGGSGTTAFRVRRIGIRKITP